MRNTTSPQRLGVRRIGEVVRERVEPELAFLLLGVVAAQAVGLEERLDRRLGGADRRRDDDQQRRRDRRRAIDVCAIRGRKARMRFMMVAGLRRSSFERCTAKCER